MRRERFPLHHGTVHPQPAILRIWQEAHGHRWMLLPAVLQPHDCHPGMTPYITMHSELRGMWQCCLGANMHIPEPNRYELSLDTATNFITITGLTYLRAPQSVMDVLMCVCHLACAAIDCACIANWLKCTQLGKLQNCNNEGRVIQEDNIDAPLNQEDGDMWGINSSKGIRW